MEHFLKAQELKYTDALSEIKKGRKISHWMWYIFPQLAHLGRSETAKFYGIKNKEEAQEYINHPVLGPRLIEISEAVLNIQDKTAIQIFGYPDDLKLRSCMELFASLPDAHPVFKKVLEKYYSS